MKINSSDTSNMFAHTIDNKMDTNFQVNSQHTGANIDLQAVLANANSQFMPKCPLCDKTFANSSNLKHHMNTIHFNEAKWICNECGKVCTSKSNLKVHLRVHLRVKPYYCRWCDYNCMHHSSIRDHLSKCHPEKSHNSCEPGYIFNSTAVPEPELSHFEPNTTLVNALNNHDYDDSETKSNKKFSNNNINNNSSSLNLIKTKRSFDDDLNISTNNTNEQDDNNTSNNTNNNNNSNTDDMKTSTLKRLKQDMEIEYNNKLFKKKNYLKKKRLRQKILMSSFSLNNSNEDKKVSSLEDEDAEELDQYDLDANVNNSNINMTSYYSDTDDKDMLIKQEDDDDDDQHNNDLLDSSNRQSSNLDEEQLFLVPNKFSNSNSNQASTSSTSSTHSSSYSSVESKTNYLKTPFNFMLQQPNDLVSALLSGLPMDYSNHSNLINNFLSNTNNNTNESKSNVNNLAAFLIQHLSKVALLQQMKSADMLKLIPNEIEADQFSSEQSKNQLKSASSNLSSNKHNRNLNCALDLSLKTNNNAANGNGTSASNKKNKLDDVDNEEYTSALSPVSTSSTNLSNTSTKSFKSSNDQQSQQQQQSQLQQQAKKSNEHMSKKNDVKKSGNKAIQDVINRLSSNLPKSKEDTIGNQKLQDDQMQVQNETCCTKEEQTSNLEELNELIKSHLVPLTEAAFDKYRDFFQKKLPSSSSSVSSQKESNDLCKTSETTNESVVSSPLSSSSPTSFVSSSDYKCCNFCNILKNLLDLHQVLHKV